MMEHFDQVNECSIIYTPVIQLGLNIFVLRLKLYNTSKFNVHFISNPKSVFVIHYKVYKQFPHCDINNSQINYYNFPCKKVQDPP